MPLTIGNPFLTLTYLEYGLLMPSLNKWLQVSRRLCVLHQLFILSQGFQAVVLHSLPGEE
jgi:hypothetical protein